MILGEVGESTRDSTTTSKPSRVPASGRRQGHRHHPASPGAGAAREGSTRGLLGFGPRRACDCACCGLHEGRGAGAHRSRQHRARRGQRRSRVRDVGAGAHLCRGGRLHVVAHRRSVQPRLRGSPNAGDTARRRRLPAKLLRSAQKIDDRSHGLPLLVLLAVIAAETNRTDRAGLLLGAAEADEARAPIPGWEDDIALFRASSRRDLRRRLRSAVARQAAGSVSTRPTNAHCPRMNEPTRPLIGRKKELADVLQLFLRDGVQLVTVTGPEGVGKTRFAEEVVAELDSPVELVDDADATQLPASPRVLATSLERLGVPGEHVYRLRPLAEAPAVELFRQRATEVNPDFNAGYRGSCRRLSAAGSAARRDRASRGARIPRLTSMAPPGDLRDWIARLESEGELVRIAPRSTRTSRSPRSTTVSSRAAARRCCSRTSRARRCRS